MHLIKKGVFRKFYFFAVNCGASPNSADANGNTPLHLTTDSALQRLLVQSGARTGIKNKAKRKGAEGNTEKELKDLEKEYKKLPSVALDKKEIDKSSPNWVADDASDSCMLCGAFGCAIVCPQLFDVCFYALFVASKYGMMNRRHHCRRCGLFCFSSEVYSLMPTSKRSFV